jgi:hypothetical protein
VFRRGFSAGVAVAVVAAGVLATDAHAAHARRPAVLRVGTYHGIAGQFRSVQAAVRAAKPGDWVLVAPGDYKENGYRGAPEPAGVLITTPGLHLRGMDRNGVVIDGTRPHTPECSPKKADQIITKGGRDGVLDLKVDGVSIENLTVCNYLTGPSGGEGNQIWFNGGDGSGKIGMGSYAGDYITATSTYANAQNAPRGEYGIFVSNANGPGTIDHSYASNMGDSAYYIGACNDCKAHLTHARGQWSSLGYSGTNSGGHLLVDFSEFDHNKTGIANNSQNNDDAPSPQIGLCPKADDKGPYGTGSCDIWRDNYIHDNNEANVVGNGVDGLAGAGPVGTGVILAGTEYVTYAHNRIENNGAWGVIVVDEPDQEEPPTDIGQNCQGGIPVVPAGTGYATCYFQAFGNDIRDNSFKHNGFFGNPTNGDIGLATAPHSPGNCFEGNTDPAGLTADPPAPLLQSPIYSCGNPNSGDMGPLAAEALCDTQLVAPCPGVPGVTGYPRPTGTHLSMPPHSLTPTMPNPCAGVPANPWCPPVTGKHGRASVHVVMVGLAVATATTPWPPVPPRRRRTGPQL